MCFAPDHKFNDAVLTQISLIYYTAQKYHVQIRLTRFARSLKAISMLYLEYIGDYHSNHPHLCHSFSLRLSLTLCKMEKIYTQNTDNNICNKKYNIKMYMYQDTMYLKYCIRLKTEFK